MTPLASVNPFYVGVLLGIFVGFVAGVLTACLLAAAARETPKS